MSGQAVLTHAPKRKVARRKVASHESVQPPNSGESGQPLNIPENAGAYLISTQLVPGELTVHPTLLGLAAPSVSEDAELEESIRKHGILQPLIVNSQKQILDGARRHGKAVKLELQTVPVIVDDRTDAVAVALSTALTRRHLNKGQRALYIFKLHNGGDKLSSRQLERRYGLCDTLFDQLNTMHKNSSDEEWAAIVAGIEAEDGSLAAQYLGYLGRLPSKGKPRTPDRVLKQRGRLMASIKSYTKHWECLEDKAQDAFISTLVKTLAAASPAMSLRLEEAFKRINTTNPAKEVSRQ